MNLGFWIWDFGFTWGFGFSLKMLYHLLYPLHTQISAFNLFRYITVRAAYAGITALILSFIFGPRLIRFLLARKLLTGTRENSINQDHKSQVPTMGGVLILSTTIISTLLWVNLTEPSVWVALFAFATLGTVGLYDDMRKVKKKYGLRPIYKLLWQIAIGCCIGAYVLIMPKVPDFRTYTSVLFFKNFFICFGALYIPFVVIVIVGTSNSTNLADGLDGLAIGLVGEVALAYAVLTYVVGNVKLSEYLNLLYVPGSGELTIFLAGIVGAALGFLWFNAHPAQIIMGDTGALALGGAIGTCAVLTKQEILLLLAGGVFVIEAGSVILQVLYFKRTRGKRLFLMTPIHHHYEKAGIKEEKIVIRFWILGILFLLATLSTLKIR